MRKESVQIKHSIRGEDENDRGKHVTNEDDRTDKDKSSIREGDENDRANILPMKEGMKTEKLHLEK